jgi:hypothetical protein
MGIEAQMIRSSRQTDAFRRPEAGGVTIILALVLVTVMGAAVFGLSRSSLRELAISGSVSQGVKAEKAADSGMDWFITWSHPDNIAANAGLGTAQGTLATTLTSLKRTDWTNSSYYPTGVTMNLGLKPWDRAVTINSDYVVGGTSDMVFNTSGAVVSQNSAGGNALVQRFDLELRFLGQRNTSGSGDPSGGTDPKAKGTMDLLWQVTSHGRATVSGTGVFFHQAREGIGVQSLSQD